MQLQCNCNATEIDKLDFWKKAHTTIQQYNTTKQQTQDYETTRRRYATRRLKTNTLSAKV